MKNLILLLSIVFLIPACGNKKSSLTFHENTTAGSTASQTQEVGFAEIKTAILTPHCLRCHAEVGTEKGLSKWVLAGNPDTSLLFTEIKSGSMPKDENPLGTQDLELVRNYIEQLAPVPKPTPTPVPTPVPIPTPTPSVTFAQIRTDVLVPYRCLNCHSVGTEASITKWINTTAPVKSLLYTRVHDGSMPQGGSRVPAAQQVELLQYVNDFAATH